MFVLQDFEVDMSYLTMSLYYLNLDIVLGGVLDFSRRPFLLVKHPGAHPEQG
jgi:hypothetical protein